MTKPAESYDRQVLEELLEKHSGRLSENQLEAFTEMLMVRTELPWERGDYARPMKPPGRRR